ncbi:LacI family transcriptional regulator [Thioclava sp. SK-1]|uniref:LacI family DNA-binding transcriptional regulator n=1 Tax=Thioclava sp. SK-1 TaxID=1889770 RepID=UPI000825D7C4|nr:LacI family DNA-binding transcriptional regulator [Thioclava sp. SK-1]OCX62257.1 LacI family transcriptional regulator [Thioclava sp. SK-1]
MSTIGKLAGVSQVTVSRALSDPAKVSPATMTRIREAIEITGFVPNAVAGALASRKSMLISAIVPSITNIVHASMVQAFSIPMREKGYEILLSESGLDAENEEKLIAAHLSRRPDAIYLTGIHHSPQARKMLMGADIPVVEVWDLTDTPIDICVGFHHSQAGRAVADFVHQSGHKRAATVSAGDERARRRRDAFSNRFADLTGSDIPTVTFEASASLSGGRQALSRLIDEDNFTEGAIFCSSDLLAHGVLVEAESRQLDIPGKVAIIGFGDQDFAQHLHPALTTVRVDRGDLGRAAATHLLKRIAGEPAHNAKLDIGFTIIKRHTA